MMELFLVLYFVVWKLASNTTKLLDFSKIYLVLPGYSHWKKKFDINIGNLIDLKRDSIMCKTIADSLNTRYYVFLVYWGWLACFCGLRYLLHFHIIMLGHQHGSTNSTMYFVLLSYYPKWVYRAWFTLRNYLNVCLV